MRRILNAWAEPVRSWTTNEVVQPLIEPILHPSPWRIRALGLSTLVGHPLFYVVWALLLPQPYESLWQRVLMSLLGLALLVVPNLAAAHPGRGATWAYSAIFWITLPVFFTWMYLCNGGNAVWFASLTAMFLIYYHLTDWRVATLGIATGLAAGWALFAAFGPQLPPLPAEQRLAHTVVFAFSWYMGLMLGLSSSNLRREQLNQALGTMGIMAHELRTPLATMALIGDAVRHHAHDGSPARVGSLDALAARLHAVVRNMNRQIDMQITNARLMRLPLARETVWASRLVDRAVQEFPYRSQRERECVQVQLVQDFSFRSSEALFQQVIDNLMKNALRALAARPTAAAPGDLLLRVEVVGGRGRISVADRGIGMDDTLRSRIFQPFFSTSRGTGHGLGLAFCLRVVQSLGGTIDVSATQGRGATFTIELPLAG